MTTLEEIVKKEIQELRDADKEQRFPLFEDMTDEEILEWVFRVFWDSPAVGN